MRTTLEPAAPTGASACARPTRRATGRPRGYSAAWVAHNVRRSARPQSNARSYLSSPTRRFLKNIRYCRSGCPVRQSSCYRRRSRYAGQRSRRVLTLRRVPHWVLCVPCVTTAETGEPRGVVAVDRRGSWSRVHGNDQGGARGPARWVGGVDPIGPRSRRVPSPEYGPAQGRHCVDPTERPVRSASPGVESTLLRPGDRAERRRREGPARAGRPGRPRQTTPGLTAPTVVPSG